MFSMMKTVLFLRMFLQNPSYLVDVPFYLVPI